MQLEAQDLIDTSTIILQKSNDYASLVVAEALVRSGDPIAQNHAIDFFRNRAWNTSLLGSDRAYWTVDKAVLVQEKVHQKRMPSAHRILEFLSEGPQTSSELHEKMNNVLSDTISVSNLGNQLKLLVEKELVIKEHPRGGRYFLAKEKSYSWIHLFIQISLGGA